MLSFNKFLKNNFYFGRDVNNVLGDNNYYFGRNSDDILGYNVSEEIEDEESERNRLSSSEYEEIPQEGKEKLIKIHKTQKKPSNIEALTLNEYSGDIHLPINRYLFGKRDKDSLSGITERTLLNHIKTLSDYLRKNKAPEDMVVMSGGRHLPNHIKVGDRITMPAFSSTTFSPDTAHSFSSYKAFDGSGNHPHYYHMETGEPVSRTHPKSLEYRHIIHIHIPEGTSGLASLEYPEKPPFRRNSVLTSYPGEGEVLLHPFHGTLIKQELNHENGTVISHILHSGELN